MFKAHTARSKLAGNGDTIVATAVAPRSQASSDFNPSETTLGNMRRRLVTAFAIPLVLAFVASSCGSSDNSAGDDKPMSTADSGTDTPDGSAPTEAEGDVDTSVVAETEAGVYGGSIIYGLEAELPGLRPWEDSCVRPCVNVARTIFDPLMQQNATGEYGGYLAESITPNEDFTVWTLTLRPDVVFHNGVPLTAQSIVDMFAIQQTGAASSGRIATAGLVSVEATDELTVVYTLDQENSAFPSNLSTVELGHVFEPAAAAADLAAFSTAPVGTGPFEMKSRDIDNETIVVRNENYWRTAANGDQLPYLDSIAFRPIPDEGTRLDALLSGTVDAIESRRQGPIRDARAASGITLYEFQGNSTGGGMYNTAVAPLDDVRVRRGLNKLVDQDTYIEALGGKDISVPATQWFSKDSPWWTQAAADAHLSFDFEGGKALLQEYVDDPARSDGKAPGEKITVDLTCPPDPTLIAAMQVLEQVWNGTEFVNVKMAQYDAAAHVNIVNSDKHQAACYYMGTDGDPSAVLNPFLADPATSVANLPNWWDPEAYGWAMEAIQTDDFETRKELYSKIMVRINDEAPVWYSGGQATMIATDGTIHGVNNWTMPDGGLGNGTPAATTYFAEMFLSD